MDHNVSKEAYPQAGVASTSRSYEEYTAMFALTEDELGAGPVLDIAGGGSSFTATLHERGIDACAADPLYGNLTDEVLAVAAREIDVSSTKIAERAGVFDWGFYGTPEKHRSIREQSLALFAEDFRRPDAAERYVAASLPNLPFADNTFSLVLCSHFLFLYADQFNEAFHEAAIREMLRVLRPGGQLGIYPLITLQWKEIDYLPALLARLAPIAAHRRVPSRLPFIPVESDVLKLEKLRPPTGI